MNTQFITDTNGKKLSVVLPFKDYKHLLEDSEELQDIKAFDKAMSSKQALIPLRKAIKERKQKMVKLYTVYITSSVKKVLAKLPNKVADALEESMLALENDPRPNGCKKLKGREGYRMRVGDYRYIYSIEDGKLIVSILDAGHRKDVYK